MSPTTVYYLEIASPDALRARDSADPAFRIGECQVRQPLYNRFLYELVGRPWQWTDKLIWTNQQWQEYVANPNLRTWVACWHGSVAGYFELLREGSDVEIRYLGLAPEFIGKGYGGPLLTHAIRAGFDWGARRVWLHTCTKDHANALANYQARGMMLYKTETKTGDGSSITLPVSQTRPENERV